jgi:hypothetical protein
MPRDRWRPPFRFWSPSWMSVHKGVWPRGQLQSRAGKVLVQRLGVPPAALHVLFYVEKHARGVLITWCTTWPRVKSNVGSPIVEEMYKG